MFYYTSILARVHRWFTASVVLTVPSVCCYDHEHSWMLANVEEDIVVAYKTRVNIFHVLHEEQRNGALEKK